MKKVTLISCVSKKTRLQNQSTRFISKSLNNMKVSEKKKWSNDVFQKLQKFEIISNTNFIFLAGENYRKYLVEKLPHYEVPMKGLQIGKQLQFLTEKLK